MFYKQKKRNNNNLLIWAYREFIKKHQWYFILYICLKTAGGMIGFVPPLFIGKAIDYAVNKNGEKVITVILMIMITLLLHSFIRIFESKVAVKINYLVTNEIKENIMKKIVDMELSDIEETGRGEFIARLEDADGIVQLFIEITNLIFIDLVAFIFALVVMFSISPVLSFICFINVPVTLIIQTIFGKKAGKKEKEIKLVNDKYYSLLYEIIDAIKEIKIFNLQEEICKRYTEKLIHLTELGKNRSDISINASFFSAVTNGFFQLMLLASGCYFIIMGAVSVGNYFTFNSYVSRFNTELNTISYFHMKKQMYLVSITRLQELFLMRSESKRKLVTKSEKWKSGDIRFEHLLFRYQENEKIILHIDNLTFAKNEISVITGKNGAGKSTLFDLIAGFYLFNGNIFIGNANINTISLERLRNEICYIQQKPYFFKKTIFENLCLKDTSLSEVEKACEKVGIHEFICTLPEQYNTIVSEEGTNFSGGQLQRLALVRAILSKAPIILLDEITSGIDAQSRDALYNVIKELKKNRTILMISHDVDSYKIADNVVYLVNGNVSEKPDYR